jgi:dihydrofolate reductase
MAPASARGHFLLSEGRDRVLTEEIMRKLSVFNSVSLDGYFTGEGGDLDWAYRGSEDPEWAAFTTGNASGASGPIILGRKTYELMVKYWPTAAAKQDFPEAAEGMNRATKIVFSRTLKDPAWSNARAVSSDPAAEVKRLKGEAGPDMIILGSGTIVALLAGAGLIDSFQLVVCPVALGKGRTMFEGVEEFSLRLADKPRAFRNGKVVLTYERAA